MYIRKHFHMKRLNPLLLECLVEIQDRIKTELDGSGSVKKETYKKTIQEIERDMNMNTL